ncbi:MAG: HNH endonuclease [Cyanobacteria bacterium P01_D01_bin.14]
MDRELYPPDWESIATEIKSRADWKCEECGRVCRRPGEDLYEFWCRICTAPQLVMCPVVAEAQEKPIAFVLTVAHLDHQPENCDRTNLRALCSGCHLRYDNQPEQRAIKRRLKRERQGQMSLCL